MGLPIRALRSYKKCPRTPRIPAAYSSSSGLAQRLHLLQSGCSPNSSSKQRGAWNACGLLLQLRRSRRCSGGDLSKARACGAFRGALRRRARLDCNLSEVHSQMVELSKIALKYDRLSTIVSKQPPKRKVHTMKNSSLVFALLALCLALPFTVATGQAQGNNQQPSAKATAKTSLLVGLLCSQASSSLPVGTNSKSQPHSRECSSSRQYKGSPSISRRSR